MSEQGAVLCVRYAGMVADRFVHPEGVCACFHGGPAPVLEHSLPVPGPRTGERPDRPWDQDGA